MLKLHRTCSGCTYGVTGDGERPVYVIMIHLSFRRCNGNAVSGELDDPAGRLRIPSTLSALPRIFDDSLCNQLLSVLCVSIFSFLGLVLLSILYLIICPLLFSTFFFLALACPLLCYPFPSPSSFFRPSCCLFCPISPICFVEAVRWNFSTGIYPVFLAWPAGSAFRMQLGSICF